MVDLAEKLSEARDRVRPTWTKERERRLHDRILERAVRRRQVRTGLSLVAALAVAVVAVFTWTLEDETVPTALVAPPAAASNLFELDDGSIVTAMSGDARVESQKVTREDVAVRLTSGAARFSVTPNREREFHVRARGVLVTVLGTVFTVDLRDDGVRVHVESGRVRVAWPSGERELSVGEEAVVRDAVTANRTLPDDEPAEEASAETSAAASLAPGAKSIASSADTASSLPKEPSEPSPDSAAPLDPDPEHSWRALARQREYKRAYQRLQTAGAYAVEDDAGDLLLAADVARLGGHPDKALTHLERVLSKHARDSRAPLAAFTLGRTLLDQLGRPGQAARAFAKVRQLDPRGTLSQDALAREVESWSRAGDPVTARARAEEYVQKYPKGARLAAVKRFGQIE